MCQFYNLSRWEMQVVNSKLMVSKIELNRDEIKDFNKYPFNIKIIKNFKNLEFNYFKESAYYIHERTNRGGFICNLTKIR